MALELGRRGAKVIVNYANSDAAAQEVVNQIKKHGSDAAAVKANVSQVEEIVRMFEEAHKKFGRLDIVCSNSGVVSFGHIKDVTPEEFDRVFNINTRGQFFVAREAYKHLEVGGRLILMGSITGQAKAVPKHTVYSASKGAIETFVRCMAIGMSHDAQLLRNHSADTTQTLATRRSPSTPSPPAASRPTCTTPSAGSTSPTATRWTTRASTRYVCTPHRFRLMLTPPPVRGRLVSPPPRRSPHRHRPRGVLPGVPRRRVDQRQGPWH